MATGKIEVSANISQLGAVSDICRRVGGRIKEIRAAKGWTQQILADHAQIERSHLARLEEGKREAGLMMLEKIANALGIDVIELLKRSS